MAIIFIPICSNSWVSPKHLELVSSYFIPTQEGTDYLTHRAQQGVKIRILTNSFQANDVALVYAYYQQYRQQLLQNGIELWEFKPYIVRPERTWYEVMTGNIIPAKIKIAQACMPNSLIWMAWYLLAPSILILVQLFEY